MAFIFIVVAALAGCASAPGRTDGQPAPSVGETTVEVRNDLDEAYAVYVINGLGGRWRLGTVMRGSSGTLSIPRDMLSQWSSEFLVTPIGPGSGQRFSCVRLAPGSHVHLVLEQSLAHSNCWMR